MMRRYDAYDAADGNLFFSAERYETAYDALKIINTDDSIEYARDILIGKYRFMCHYKKKLNFDIVWSSIFAISGKRILRAEGNSLRRKYIIDNRLFA